MFGSNLVGKLQLRRMMAIQYIQSELDLTVTHTFCESVVHINVYLHYGFQQIRSFYGNMHWQIEIPIFLPSRLTILQYHELLLVRISFMWTKKVDDKADFRCFR